MDDAAAIKDIADRQIKEMKAAGKLKYPVRGIKVEFGTDSTGDPAAWIWIVVDDDLDPSREKVLQLNRLTDAVRDALLERSTDPWPYVGLRAAA